MIIIIELNTVAGKIEIHIRIQHIHTYSTRPKVFEQIEFVPQVAHGKDTYATLNISL